LEERLSATVGADYSRVVFLNMVSPHAAVRRRLSSRLTARDMACNVTIQMPYEHYLDLQSQADVVLDPYPFGGGVTMLEAIAAGTPFVTFGTSPPVYHSGRCSAHSVAYVMLSSFTSISPDNTPISRWHGSNACAS
jgi:glycosyltransferase involved in cell wall biosynthesis